MNYRLLIVIVSLCLIAGISASFAAGLPAADNDAFCEQIKKEISAGADAKDVTRDNIRAGIDACRVIRCAIAAGGHPQRAISGAREAGAAPDLVSRCAVGACAEANRSFEFTNFCSIIKSDIEHGMDPRKVIRDRISAGSNASSAIRCAIASGADLKQVFAGAKDAGITSDVIARCSVDACVDPALVAAIVQDIGMYGLGYSYYDEDFIPIDTVVPGGTKGTYKRGRPSYRPISPSTF